MMADRTMGLGRLLREYRREARMTQAELAEAVGLERCSITNIEGGNQVLTLENLSRIADALGLEARIELVRFKEPKRRLPPPADHITVSIAPANQPTPAAPIQLADITPRCRECSGFGFVSAGADFGTASCPRCFGTGKEPTIAKLEARDGR